MSRFLVVHSIAWNRGGALAGLEGIENRGAGVAVARRQDSVREVMIDFDHVLVGAIGQIWRGDKISAGLRGIWFREKLEKLRADGVHRDLDVLAGGLD